MFGMGTGVALALLSPANRALCIPREIAECVTTYLYRFPCSAWLFVEPQVKEKVRVRVRLLKSFRYKGRNQRLVAKWGVVGISSLDWPSLSGD